MDNPCRMASVLESIGRMALSTMLNHLPPLTPLPSADTMRSVQIEASAHHFFCPSALRIVVHSASTRSRLLATGAASCFAFSLGVYLVQGGDSPNWSAFPPPSTLPTIAASLLVV